MVHSITENNSNNGHSSDSSDFEWLYPQPVALSALFRKETVERRIGPTQAMPVFVRDCHLQPFNTRDLEGIRIYYPDGHAEAVYAVKADYLSPRHAEELRSSGISPAVARQLKIHTVSGPGLLAWGYNHRQNYQLVTDPSAEFLVYPYWNPDGSPMMWRREAKEHTKGGKTVFDEAGQPVMIPEGNFWLCNIRTPENKQWTEGHKRKGKYRAPTGSPNALYIPAPLDDRYGSMVRAASAYGVHPIRFIEGEKKAICSYLHTGTLTLGLKGVRSYTAHWVMDYVLAAKSTQILFDNDIWVNPQIEAALIGFAEYLVSGAEQMALHHCYTTCKEFANTGGEGDQKNEAIREGLEQSLNEDFKQGWESIHPQQLGNLLDGLSYTLLPKHSEGKKLGIDDWLIGEGLVDERGIRPIAQRILSMSLPLFNGRAIKKDLFNIWATKDITRRYTFRVGPDHVWCWGVGLIKAEKKENPYLSLTPIDHKFCKDFAAQLVAATAIMGSAVYERPGISYVWGENRTWGFANDAELFNHLNRVRISYNQFPNGNSGILGLILTEFKAYGQGSFESPEYIGFADCDMHMMTGKQVPIDPANRVMVRSRYALEAGSPKKYRAALAQQMPGSEELYWAMLRLTFAPHRECVDFLPYLVGPPGCGKSSLLRVALEVLPGCIAGKISQLQGGTALDGYFPMDWYGSKMVVDFEQKEFLTSGTVTLLNSSADGDPAAFRLMGGHPMNKPTTFTFWAVGNKPPKLRGEDSEGFLRRYVQINCVSANRPNNNRWSQEIIEEEAGQILGQVFSMSVEKANQVVSEALDSQESKEAAKELLADQHEACLLWLYNVDSTKGQHGTDDLLWVTPLTNLGEEYSDEYLWVHSTQAYTVFREWGKRLGYKRTSAHWLDGLEQLGCNIPRRKNGKGVKQARIRGTKMNLIGLKLPD